MLELEPQPLRRISWPPPDSTDPDALVSREWLVTNGLGGYASGTLSGANTRRYHGMLVVALTPPTRRMTLLSKLEETVTIGS